MHAIGPVRFAAAPLHVHHFLCGARAVVFAQPILTLQELEFDRVLPASVHELSLRPG
jgi:hypothetical protein